MPFVLQELIKQIQEGDKNAFRVLVEKYQQSAFGLAFRMLGDVDEARDIAQDSFIRIWEKFDTYNENEKFTSWMYRIVSNRAIDRLRAIKRQGNISLERINPAKLENIESGADKAMEDQEVGELIQYISSGLPEKQRLVFSLRDLQGLSSQEVQEISGLSEDTIKSNLYHARKTIRERLVTVFVYERSGL